MDLISRQAAIDALTEYWDGISDRHPTLDGEMAVYADCKGIIKRLPSAQPEQFTVNFVREMDRETIEKLKEGFRNSPVLIMAVNDSAQPQWIPCSERLPEEGMNCLVCDKGSVAIDTFIGHGNPYNWKWYTRDYEAWMPLPEPWRGEENERG